MCGSVKRPSTNTIELVRGAGKADRGKSAAYARNTNQCDKGAKADEERPGEQLMYAGLLLALANGHKACVDLGRAIKGQALYLRAGGRECIEKDEVKQKDVAI